MLRYFLSFLSGYLVGSIPTAYLIVRRHSAIDIRAAGSGKVGGFNAFQVTESRITGVLVGLVDGLKGLLVTAAWLQISPDSFWTPALGLVGAIAGHNYPVWLRFRGGRGLATTAGGFFLMGFLYTVIWCTTWLLVKAWKKDILTANVTAIMLTPLFLLLVPAPWIEKLMIVRGSAGGFVLFSFLISAELVLSHLDALSGAWNKIVGKVVT